MLEEAVRSRWTKLRFGDTRVPECNLGTRGWIDRSRGRQPKLSLSVCKHWGRWRNPGFGGDFERTVEGELDFVRGFLSRIAVRYDAQPFDNLCEIAVIAFDG